MAKVFVQFTDEAGTAVCAVYGCPQDPAAHPFQAEIENTDPRYLAFIGTAPTPEQFAASCEAEAQGVLDTLAKSWGYDSMSSMISYINSSNSTWKAEANAGNAWRDALWAQAQAIESAVQAGTQAMPATVDAFLALLPSAPARPTT